VILSPVLLQEQTVVVLLLGRVLASWSLALDEHGGHQDLCGSGHRSVMSYVYGRTVLYCSSLSCLCEPETFFQPFELVSTWSFYSLRSGNYIETRGPTDGSKVVETLYII
jgi:hypothetical protein